MPKALEMAARHGGENTVILLFDIDNTILAMNGDLGSNQWYEWQKSLDKNDDNKIDSLLSAQKSLFFIKSMRLTQLDVPDILNEYKEKGFQTAALTARSMNMSLVTFRELKRNEIEFFNNMFPADYKNNFMPLTTKAKRNVLYDDFVIMAAGQNKGKVFLELLSNATSNQIKAIIFVDDKESNLIEFESALKESKYDLISFKYGGEDMVVNKFDSKKTINDWCGLEKILHDIQQINDNDNFKISGVKTKACRN